MIYQKVQYILSNVNYRKKKFLIVFLLIYMYKKRYLFNKTNFIDILLKLPIVGKYIMNKIKKNTKVLENELNKNIQYQQQFPIDSFFL